MDVIQVAKIGRTRAAGCRLPPRGAGRASYDVENFMSLIASLSISDPPTRRVQ